MRKEDTKSYFDKPTTIIIKVIILVLAFVGWIIYYGNQYTEHEYMLSEVNDGVYAIYYNTSSRIPSQNYEVVTLCCEGNVYTFKGDVYISYIKGNPYAKVKSYNTVNNDEIHVYVPQGTVSYQESVNIR